MGKAITRRLDHVIDVSSILETTIPILHFYQRGVKKRIF